MQRVAADRVVGGGVIRRNAADDGRANDDDPIRAVAPNDIAVTPAVARLSGADLS